MHGFRYPVMFLCFPLAQVESLSSGIFSLNRFNIFSFHFRDHGSRDGEHPRDWIGKLLEQNNMREAAHDVWLQTFPRILGFVFNPVSFWYCHDSQGDLMAVVCEVNNTFGETHLYLLNRDDNSPIQEGDVLSCRKIFHVSPFFDVHGHYEFRFSALDKNRSVSINYYEPEGLSLKTVITGRPTELNSRNLVSSLLRNGWMTVRIVVGIHWQALKLWLKGARFHSKPNPPEKELSR